MKWLACIIFALLLGAQNAYGHSSSRSFSTWHEDGDTVRAVYTVDEVQATLLIPLQEKNQPLSTLLAGHLAASLHVRQSGAPCRASVPRTLPAPSGSLRMQIIFSCPNNVKTAGWTLRDDAFFPFASTHVHIAQIENDSEAREFVFTDTWREHTMREPQGARQKKSAHTGFWVNFATYIRLGISHILHGFDHLAFVTALILLARSYKAVALLVTGFTLGHSVTLALASLGIIHPSSVGIEALIGFSIAFVAFEVLIPPKSADWQRSTRAASALFAALALSAAFGFGALPPQIWAGLSIFVFSYGLLVRTTQAGLRASLALTIAFGLVHGAGFATVLSEAGLPKGQALPALAGFNIGVEIGQLAVIVLWLIVFALLQALFGAVRKTQAQGLIALIILVLGIYWFSGRALFSSL